MTPRQKELALRIFTRLGEAEARVHGSELSKVHFHEVGAVDSIIDIVGAAVGLDLLGVDRFEASPIPPGSGWVRCDHGKMPLPAPATAELLKGVPLAESEVEDGVDHAHRRGDRDDRGRAVRHVARLTARAIGLVRGRGSFPGRRTSFACSSAMPPCRPTATVSGCSKRTSTTCPARSSPTRRPSSCPPVRLTPSLRPS